MGERTAKLLNCQQKEILFALLEFKNGATAYDLEKKLTISVSPILQHLKKLEKALPKLINVKEMMEKKRYKRNYVLTAYGKRTAIDLMRKRLVKYASVLGRFDEKRKVLDEVRQSLETSVANKKKVD
jgi:predicted ArsR family transcriptional regulator